MRKKKLTAGLAGVISLALLAGCGQTANVDAPKPANAAEVTKEPEAEVTPSVEVLPESQPDETRDARNATDFEFVVNYDYEKATESGTLTAYYDDGSVAWEYNTDEYYSTELERVQDVGLNVNGYYLIEGGSLICLSVAGDNAGQIEWRNDEFLGAGAVWCFDDYGCIYLCGYYGPDLMVIDGGGNTVNRVDMLDLEDTYWPGVVSYNDGNVTIHFDSNDSVVTLDENLEIKEIVSKADYYSALLNKKDTWDERDLRTFLGGGCWLYEAPSYSPFDISLYIDAQGNFSFEVMDNSEFFDYYYYKGKIELGHFQNSENEAPDYIAFKYSSVLSNAGGDPLELSGNLGEYLINDITEADGTEYMDLTQINNGFSVMSQLFEDYMPTLYREVVYLANEEFDYNSFVGEWNLTDCFLEGDYCTASEKGTEGTVTLYDNLFADYTFKDSVEDIKEKKTPVFHDEEGFYYFTIDYGDFFDEFYLYDAGDGRLGIDRYTYDAEEPQIYTSVFTGVYDRK